VHKIDIPRHVLERAVARRGRQHIFDPLDPLHTAHIVVDLQNGFMAPGQQGEIAPARDIVPNVNRISAALRKAGGMVVFIQNTVDAADLSEWSVHFDLFSRPERRERLEAAFRAGSFGHELWPDLSIEPQDLKVKKHRYSAFIQGSSDLHSVLQQRRIDTLIITGTATNICCESTARDASMMNYKVIFAADGTATYTDSEHNATLGSLLSFVDVMTTEEIVERISAAAARGQDRVSAA
jgi:ureidoacrylate peracid hydrolase